MVKSYRIFRVSEKGLELDVQSEKRLHQKQSCIFGLASLAPGQILNVTDVTHAPRQILPTVAVCHTVLRVDMSLRIGFDDNVLSVSSNGLQCLQYSDLKLKRIA